jgi:hypothetical protein
MSTRQAKYDFSKGKRGAVLPQAGNIVRITIRPGDTPFWCLPGRRKNTTTAQHPITMKNGFYNTFLTNHI